LQAAIAFAESTGISGPDLSVHELDAPFADRTDLIVNALGPGDPKTIRAAGASIAQITEAFDLRILQHLERHPETTYAFLSTGAVYGSDYGDREHPRRLLETDTKALGNSDHYPRAKLEAEARHRARGDLRIADVRIFGYFSRFIDLNGGFLMSEISRAVLNDRVFQTDGTDFVRDYIGPGDLTNLLLRLLNAGSVNFVVEARSAAPTTKLALLRALASEFGLKCEISGAARRLSIRSALDRPPMPDSAAMIGYVPSRTSEQTLIEEMRALRDAQRHGTPYARSGACQRIGQGAIP
jgi:nucleoside-diphosphate-sugar epimerase